jgi:XTP/dITP diphosphohydrolase
MPRNNERLLRELKEDRKAYYACVMVLTRSAFRPAAARRRKGLWRGEIAPAPRGANGFGYDPLFFLKDYGRSGCRARSGRKEPDQPPRAGARPPAGAAA